MGKSPESRRINEAYARRRALRDTLQKQVRNGVNISEEDFRRVDEVTELYVFSQNKIRNQRRDMLHKY